MKDFYNNNKKLCLIIAALLLFALCRMAIYDRKYYVSKNKVVVINRFTGYAYWYYPRYKTPNLLKDLYPNKHKITADILFEKLDIEQNES